MATKALAETKTSVRDRRVQLVMAPGEWDQIHKKAEEAGLSFGGFMRAAALGKRISSNADKDAIQSLMKLSADQGRLGGLFKLWLSDRPGVGAPEIEVIKALRGTEALRARIWEAIARQ